MQMTKANFNGSKWILDHLDPEKTIDFGLILEGVLRADDRFYVIIAPRQKLKTPRANIMCYDLEGNKLWDIQDPNNSASRPEDRSCYDAIWFGVNNELYAHAGSSEYKIDPNTGAIIDSKWTR